ncbi:non-ribosomal peptide synthetase, partial [Pseudoalteromonas rubra]|uniref:non-ribosomal peptide synthetase n=1 Tax=Pseudoalteromonas rubra TaxID=43658 RepID=UPI000F79FFFA
RLDITVEPEDLAYVIYTSGSTGTPKGVMVEHHAVAAHIHCVTQHFDFSPSDNILQLTSFAFDTFIEQTWAALISGGTVILSERLLSVDDFFASVARFGVTITDLPPAYLAECLLPEYTAQWQTSTLRLVVIGGEAVSAQTLQRWFELGLPHCKLINGYGPTEAVVTATVQELELQDTSEPRIGTVFGPRRLYVLDADQQLVPSGCVGELYIGGAALARGYLNRPEETQQRFLPDPFNAGTRMYRTGDLVAYDKAHALRYLGRVDDQVKIRGYRIEVQEVAHRIAELDGVQEAFVMVQQQDGHKCLVGYFQPTHDASSCDADWIKQQLLQSLPDYMVPATILAVPQWPLNHNGKIDKQRLPVAQQAPSVQAVVAPKTSTEQQLLEIWQHILPASGNEFGTQESFFELGGHSLLVVRMVAQIREKMALDVAIKSVFEYPTISSLSAYIERLSPDSAEQSEIKPIARDRAHYPVSFAQQRLWFIDKMDGGSAQYNMPMAFRVHGAFCVQSAQTALNRIIARHESLRTNFIDIEQGPAQLVHPQRRLSVTIVDLTETHNPEQEINQFLHQDALRVFDLQADLLMRASYLSLPHQSGIFVLNMHHIVSDGWSLGNLSREFLIQYQSVCHDTPDPLSPLAIQYPDYASWQRTWISAERLDQQLAFWQSQLDGLPATHSIPLDHPRPQEKGLHGSACISHLTQQQVEGLQQLALRSRSTLFMVLHSVLATLIAKLSNNSDVVIATPVANRQSSQLEPLIGFFVNTLVLRVNAKHDTFSALLRHVTEVNLAAQQHQDVPFDYLVEHCQITRSKQHTPVFQIMFSMDTSDDGTDEMAMQDVTFEALEGLANTAKFDLDISAEQGADGMAMQWNYDTSIFNHETVVRMAEQFGKLVEQVVHQPDLPMGQISLLDAQTKESLLQASQGAKHELSQQLSLPALLLRQAQATPAAPCLITAQQQWNYQQFNTLTNQLARYLSGMGIEPGCRVALTATRSAINLQLLVAIMKLGAVYVPIDLSWPAARLDYIIEAADIRCVISEPLAESLALPCEHWVITADILDSEVAQQTPSDLTLPVGLSDLAYILFTSGTSGVPKGVMQTHRTLVNLALDMQSQGIDGAKRTLLFTPMTFDVSLQELACAWQTGSALVSITQSQKDDLPQLANLLEQLRIERAFMPPAVLQLLSETAHSQGHTLADLQQVIVAGEALYLSDEIRQLLHRCNHLQLWNHYGPTETHVVTSKRVDSVQDPIAVPIGAPIANCAAYILDDYHQLVPHGTSGELYLAGAGLAAGYLDPGQTQAAFVASLNPELPHQVLYKSGDIARFNHLSEIEYLSRNDEQIQLRGYRVELSEIETHLLALPWVQQAVVQVSNVGKADAALVAYVVAEDTAQSAELVTKIKAALSDSLPAYMIPSVIMLLPALPLTHNGKLDKRALPTPEVQLDESACVAPVTSLEKALVGIWSEMLNIPEP